jgi:signal transduction histidine kinase/AraC-like DNA-binding protein
LDNPPKKLYLHFVSHKILVVDDEPDVELIFRQKFRRRIRAGELDFVFAENGKQALDLLHRMPEISLMFTDINMPLMNGLALLRESHALQRPLFIPLVISAYDDMANIREAMNQGAFDFVTKPLEIDELERVLNKALGELEKVAHGIEAARKLEEAEQQKDRAEYSRRLQKEFFENITHELRTPLTLLLGPLESALGVTSEETVKQFLSQARRNGQLLLDLVNQLLDFASIDAQRMALDLQPLDAVQTARELTDAFRPLTDEKGVLLHFHSAVDTLTITADAKKLLRILLNLLSNAAKFTPSGERVDVTVEATEKGVQFRVRDTGPGIAPDQHQGIFERFGQGDVGQKSPYQGTGIGLALSKALTELHGGRISLKSEENAGAEFIVDLPREPVVASEIIAPSESKTNKESPTPFAPLEPQITPSSSAEEEETESAPLVLLTEDNPEMRTYIEGLLQPHYRVVSAENGRLGFELAKETVPDLIVSDWMMPDLDGVGMLELLRIDRATSHIPVILLTAKAQADHRIEGLQTGAEAYLSKPFHPEELLAQIKSLLQQRERLRERFRQDFLRPEKVESTSMEDQFLGDVKRVMEKFLNNEAFGVEMMADELAMSRRTLGRKLTALSGESPVRFIRHYRLERGRNMLIQNAAPVWEVALKTGFGSSSYFTKCFKDHYGISPREAVEQA